MTEAELRAKYTTAYKIIQRERRMREVVFANSPKRAEKLAEMDRLLEIVTEMKDFCKAHMEPEFEQPALIDVPLAPSGPQAKRTEYT